MKKAIPEVFSSEKRPGALMEPHGAGAPAAGIFISGSGTDVGKTLATAALLAALGGLGQAAKAVKIVQTGAAAGDPLACAAADERIYALAAGRGGACSHATLRCFTLPASPHLAAGREGQKLAAADLKDAALAQAAPGRVLLLEGAGGLAVPLNEQEDMLDLMRLLDLPVLLVCANILGALNHARLSLMALESAGLELFALALSDVRPAASEAEALVMDDNEAFLRRGLPGGAPMLRLPWLEGGPERRLCRAAALMRPLAARLARRRAGPGDLAARDRAMLWHPYASATRPPRLEPAARSHGNRIVLEDGRELIDGMSSWWAAIHGYNHPRLLRALRSQAGRMPHVMFGGITHRPAVELGERLLRVLPESMERVFFADSGSVAVEVALKMALQYQQGAGNTRKSLFLAPRGGYHGDTMGAMSVCDPETGMHSLFSGFLPRQIFMERPACRFDGEFDPASLAEAKKIFEEQGERVAAVILEPIVQGAGGMWFYHPGYLAGLAGLCRQYGSLLIADEIATGFGRTGKYFACQWAGIEPDIVCCGKALSGGMMTLAATACSGRVARGICAGGRALMHGPTFMANPLACAAACASLDLLAENRWQADVARIGQRLAAGLGPLGAMPGVADARVLGAIGVVEMEEAVNTESLQAFFVGRGVWIRPFGRLIYLMPPYISPDGDIDELCSAVAEAVGRGAWLGGQR